MCSLGSRAFFDPSTDNRHFSDCGTCVFPAVFHVRRHTQILGVWRAESFLSCGYFPVFLVSIHLGSGIWDRTSNEQQRRLSKVSRASLTLPRVAFLPEFFFLSVSITFLLSSSTISSSLAKHLYVCPRDKTQGGDT